MDVKQGAGASPYMHGLAQGIIFYPGAGIFTNHFDTEDVMRALPHYPEDHADYPQFIAGYAAGQYAMEVYMDDSTAASRQPNRRRSARPGGRQPISQPAAEVAPEAHEVAPYAERLEDMLMDANARARAYLIAFKSMDRFALSLCEMSELQRRDYLNIRAELRRALPPSVSPLRSAEAPTDQPTAAELWADLAEAEGAAHD